MFSKFSEDCRKALLLSKKEMMDLKHPYIGTEHFILAILSMKRLNVTKKLNDNQITYDKYKELLIEKLGLGISESDNYVYTPLFKEIIEKVMDNNQYRKNSEIRVEDILSAIIEEGDGVGIRILLEFDLDIEELYQSLLIRKNKKNAKKSLFCEEFGTNLNQKAKNGELDPIIGRDEEINQIIKILCHRNKNNPLLIGEAGVGKTAIVEELARRIVMGDVPGRLSNKKIISISMASLVAGTKYRGEFEERVNKILKELENDSSLIVFIDEIHTLIGAGGAEGAIDASNILKPALSRGKITLIGATTTLEYKRTIESDKALARRFQSVLIKEPNKNKTLDILLSIKDLYEDFHHVKIPNEIIEYIIDVSDRYIHNRSFPDKAIDILDEVSSFAVVKKNKNEENIINLKRELLNIRNKKSDSIRKQKFNEASLWKKEEKNIEDKINKLQLKKEKGKNVSVVTRDIVNEVIEKYSNIKVFDGNVSKKYFTDMEKDLNREVVGQKSSINSLCKFNKIIKYGLKNDNKPLSILFAGPTGVGKTKLAKEFAKYYGNKFIRLDMSEYRDQAAINKIIGSPPGYVGYSDKNTVLEKIKTHPFSVLLLDEIEKASKQVLNLFLQVLDEGYLTDSEGEKVYFNDVIIIMTSNIGFDRKALGFSSSEDEYTIQKLREYFNVEFINRIDKILVFNSLNEEDMKKIITNKLETIKNKYRYKFDNIDFSTKLVQEIIDLSDYNTFGARQLDKIIYERLENVLIDNIIDNNREVRIKSIC